MKKKILILGGSSDIGSKVVLEFLNNGWQVFAHFNKKKNIFKNSIKNRTNLVYVKCNFDKINDYEKFIKRISKEKIDSIINLVGYIDNISYQKTNIFSLIKSLKINTIVPLLIQKKLIPFMIKKNFGRILNISSIGIKYGGGEFNFNYSFSKHALEFIPKYLRGLSQKNILTNILRVGFVNTKMHKRIKNKNISNRIKLIPMKRSATKEEVSKLIFFLASEKNTYITNETITIAGGE